MTEINKILKERNEEVLKLKTHIEDVQIKS